MFQNLLSDTTDDFEKFFFIRFLELAIFLCG